jgi:hypothetical protein
MLDVLLLQQRGNTLRQIGRELIHRFEQRQKKLLGAWTVHESSSLEQGRKGI